MQRLAPLLVVALVVLTAGCLDAGVPTVEDDVEVDSTEQPADGNGTEILAATVNATDDVETYRADGEVAMSMTTAVFGVHQSMTVNGSFDRGERRAAVDTDGVFEVGAFGMRNGTAFETAVYATENATYRTGTGPSDDADGDWWVNGSGYTASEPANLSLGDLSSLLGDADARVVGTETVDGVETYVLELDVPPERQLAHFGGVLKTYGTVMDGNDGNGDEADGQAEFEASEAYLWVERDSARPRKFASYGSLTFEGEDGLVSLDGTVTYRLETAYSAYDGNVTVALPTELRAQPATDP